MSKDYKNKLVVYIPIHNRQYFSNRVFHHYKLLATKYNVPVIARDSSEAALKTANEYPWIDYEWVGPSQNATKLLDVLEEVDTEFFLIAPDDDFYLSESIIKCVDFLSKNPKYSVAHGEFLSLCSKQNKILRTAYKLQFYNGITEKFYSEYAHHRLLHFLNVERYIMLNHSLIRRKVYLKGHKIFLENKYLKIGKFSDFLHAFALLCFGNVKTLPIVWAFRDTNRIMGTKNYPKEFNQEIDLTHLPSRLIQNSNPLSKLLVECSGLSLENASLVLGQCLGMNLYGRFHTNEVHRKGAEITDFTFPSETEEFREEINSVLHLVKKYSDQLPQD